MRGGTGVGAGYSAHVEVRGQLVGFGALSFHHVGTRIELRPSGLVSTFILGAICQPLGTAYVLLGISLLTPVLKCILKYIH